MHIANIFIRKRQYVYYFDEDRSIIVLNEYKVTVVGNEIKLNGSTRYGECTVIDIIPLSGYGSAGK